MHLTLHNVLRVHLPNGLCQSLISFSSWVIFHRVHRPHFVYSSPDEHVSFFHPVTIVTSAAMNVCVQVSVLSVSFQSLEWKPRSKSLSHMVIFSLTFWGTTRLFSTAATSFCIPASNAWGFHPRQHLFLLWLIFLTMAVPVSVKWVPSPSLVLSSQGSWLRASLTLVILFPYSFNTGAFKMVLVSWNRNKAQFTKNPWEIAGSAEVQGRRNW